MKNIIKTNKTMIIKCNVRVSHTDLVGYLQGYGVVLCNKSGISKMFLSLGLLLNIRLNSTVHRMENFQSTRKMGPSAGSRRHQTASIFWMPTSIQTLSWSIQQERININTWLETTILHNYLVESIIPLSGLHNKDI